MAEQSEHNKTAASKLRDLYARLPEIKARAEKATPPPWTYDALLSMANVSADEAVMPDVEFMSAARLDVPDLVEAVEAQRALLEECLAYVGAFASSYQVGHNLREIHPNHADTLTKLLHALGRSDAEIKRVLGR